MRNRFLFLCMIFISGINHAQHSFSGYLDDSRWQNNVYLSVIEDYRKISGVYSEQIIAKIQADSAGFFEFKGDQLEQKNRIYRLHVDNCDDGSQNQNHFDGHCDDSKEILFIANHNDTIAFPFSFDNEMFCSIQSSNPKSNAFVSIDSIKNEMKFAFSEFRSEANRKLNNKKWFKTLQKYGESFNEPIAELYIYAFLSERSNNFHAYYLEDLKTNSYYDDLRSRLTTTYPNSAYTAQYKSELGSDKFIITDKSNDSQNKGLNFNLIVYILLVISLLFNLILFLTLRKNRVKKKNVILEQLTKQEQNILNLLLEEKSNKEIADALFVSVSTVKTHINNVYRKLNVQSRDEVKSLLSK
ncbi:helix-turn-helix transcriptional regulator [Flavobacteriales bacterium 34_180_T64]|nr:helix-turn-helix transcriptional regulator [Flavobacteriales bacterium 34_180_T64]